MKSSAVVRVKKVSGKKGNSVPIPRYATGGSAGLDLAACLEKPVCLQPGDRAMIPSGIAIEIPDRNMAGLIFPRSGLAARHGIALSNGVGVIDSDYKGEIIIAVFNQGKEEYTISPGERIAQIVFVPVYDVTMEEAEELEDTERGTGGFGSTGKS
ncbi:MAG TPA: dUTP diphosphatase [Bacillota bacterium]|nr:dUTP diphosphatase [Bacillota bacterium]